VKNRCPPTEAALPPFAVSRFDLLARGLREFESFFPGFEARMRERGAVSVESGWDTATLWPHGWARRTHSGLLQLYASRPLIESTVLEFSRRLTNVTFLERTEVTALRAERGATAPAWRSASAMTGRPARSKPTW
jgi:hypothetical protein